MCKLFIHATRYQPSTQVIYLSAIVSNAYWWSVYRYTKLALFFVYIIYMRKGWIAHNYKHVLSIGNTSNNTAIAFKCRLALVEVAVCLCMWIGFLRYMLKHSRWIKTGKLFTYIPLCWYKFYCSGYWGECTEWIWFNRVISCCRCSTAFL